MNPNLRPQQAPPPPIQQQMHAIHHQSPMRFNYPHQSSGNAQQSSQRQFMRPPNSLPMTPVQQRPPPNYGPHQTACLPSPMPISAQEQHDQTMMWASQNYVFDSGFHTAQTRSVMSSSCFSGVSSLTGMESESGYYDPNFGGAPGPSGPVFVQPGQCDMGATNFDFSGGQQGGPYMTQQAYFQASASGYPDPEAELDNTTAAALIPMLKDKDNMKAATSFVYAMSKKRVKAEYLAGDRELLGALVTATMIGIELKDNELVKWGVGTLYLVSTIDEGKEEKIGLEAIYRTGVVPALVGLLNSEFEAVLYYTTTILHNLLLHHMPSRDVVRSADGVQALVKLLARDHDKFLAIVTDSLRSLCAFHLASKIKVCECGAPAYLVRLLEHSNYEKLLWMSARLILALTACHSNKEALVKAGCIQALARHLAHPSHRLVLTCLNSLRDLSDAATGVEGVENLLDSLIQNLGSSDNKVVDFCVAILYNLTCKNTKNKDYVCSQMGIESLVRTLVERWAHPAIAENTLGTLRHLTWKCGSVQVSRNNLRSLGGLPLIAQYLHVHKLPQEFFQHPAVLAEALGLLRNLTNCGGASWPDFRHYDIVNATAKLTVIIVNTLPTITNNPPLVNAYLDVLEKAFGALSGLCQDEENRMILLSHQDIGPLAQDLMHHPVASIKAAAAGFLKLLQGTEQTSDSGLMSDDANDFDPDNAFGYEADFMQQQQMQAAAFPNPMPMPMNPDEQAWPRHQNQQPHPHPHPQQQQHPMPHDQLSISMPSPMSWSQQELAANLPNYDPIFAGGLMNEMDFTAYNNESEPHQRPPDNVAGPSYTSSCTAVEPMKNLRL